MFQSAGKAEKESSELRFCTGCECKLCDDCDQMVHLRKLIFHYRSKASLARSKPRAAYCAGRATMCLERYMLLVMFDAFLAARVKAEGGLLAQRAPARGQTSLTSPKVRLKFSRWLGGRPVRQSEEPHSLPRARPLFLWVCVERSN